MSQQTYFDGAAQAFRDGGVNPFNQVDAHWLTEFYITNLANKNAVVYTNEGNFDLRETVNEPRVFGVRVSYRFGKQQPSNTEN